MAISLETDINALILILTQTGDYVKKGVASKMLEGGYKMRDKARDYAPVDLGNLEKAIKLEHDRAGIHGRREVTVYVDEGMSVEGREEHTVAEYAMRMHEGSYNLGKKSLEKESALGVQVGPKYLERAADDTTAETVGSMLSEARKRLLVERGHSVPDMSSDYESEEDY